MVCFNILPEYRAYILWQMKTGSGIIKTLMLLVDRRRESNRRLKYRLLYMEQSDGKSTAYKGGNGNCYIIEEKGIRFLWIQQDPKPIKNNML